MASIAVGHQLYLYRLFSKEVGTGRQVMLSRMEEVLDANDIWPSDLGCTTVRELLEQLSDFVRLTAFKKGRVYATVIAKPEWDALLERAEKEQASPADKGGMRSWKRKKSKREPKPIRPRPKGRPKPQDEAAEVADVETTNSKAAPSAEESAVGHAADPGTAAESAGPAADPGSVEPAAQPETAAQPGHAAESAAAVHAAKPHAAEKPTANGHAASLAQDTASAKTPSHEPAPSDGTSPTDEAKPVVIPTTQPPIKLTIISDPTATDWDEEFNETELFGTDFSSKPARTTEPTAEPEHSSQSPREANRTPSPTTQSALPHDFGAQVLIHNDELNALYQMLPLDQDPIAVLDEDWRVARSTHDFLQQRGVITFPLRYLASNGDEPVHVSMQRTGASAAGKRWCVTSIDHVDNVGLEGLAHTNSEVMRELAQFGVLGTWDTVVQKLEDALAGAKTPLAKEELRDYLCITFHRLQCENKVAAYAQGTRAIFDTGLLDANANSVLMDFHANEDEHKDDIPWVFSGFVAADKDGIEGVLPQPASYIADLCDIMILSEKDVSVSRAVVRAHGDDVVDAINATLRRIRRDYRLATPAYDPLTNEVRLLAPIEWPADVLQALVLQPSNEGFVASALLSLERAAVCARIVSFELPRWLVEPQ